MYRHQWCKHRVQLSLSCCSPALRQLRGRHSLTPDAVVHTRPHGFPFAWPASSLSVHFLFRPDISMALIPFRSSLERSSWSGWMNERCHELWWSQILLLFIQNNCFLLQWWWQSFCNTYLSISWKNVSYKNVASFGGATSRCVCMSCVCHWEMNFKYIEAIKLLKFTPKLTPTFTFQL